MKEKLLGVNSAVYLYFPCSSVSVFYFLANGDYDSHPLILAPP